MPSTSNSSRKPGATQAAARPATSRRKTEPDEEPEVTAAEAQEIEAEGHYVTGLLCGEEVRIIPPGAWRQSWQELLNTGQIRAFMEIVLHEDDYEIYEDLDPTGDGISKFAEEASRLSGEALGKSSGPSRSSRSTRKR